MPEPCECPARKALEHLRKSCEGTPLLTYIDAALSAPCLCDQLRAELAEALDALKPFEAWFRVMSVLLEEDRRSGIERKGGWEDLDPVLGVRGQVVTRGHFKRAAAVLAKHPEVKA